MPQTQVTKNYNRFVAGLHTEVTPLTFPENSVTEIENFDLKIDGSLRRRKGLAFETGSVFKDIPSTFTNGTDAVTEHFWRNAGGSDTHIHIVQVGDQLVFYTDARDILGQRIDTVDLNSHRAKNSTVTTTQIAAQPVDISWGRGQALVTQRHINPFFLEFNEVAGTVCAFPIEIFVRDFAGINDGIGSEVNPVTLTTTHKYNLRNQGWRQANITSFSGTDPDSLFPGKNMPHWLAFKRTLTAGNFYDNDGVRTFSHAKIVAEPLGQDDAPAGHFLVDPFDTSIAGGTGKLEITTWSISGTTTGPQTITVTTAQVHGLVAGDSTSIEGQNALMNVVYLGNTFEVVFTFNGVYTIGVVPSTTTFEIPIIFLSNGRLVFVAFTDQFNQLGTVGEGIDNPDGERLTVRPTTNAYFAGRAWYAGTPGGKVGQSVLFSQVIEVNGQYGRCFQEADPTNEERPDIVESDGGQIFIPEAGRVLKLMPFGQSMLVMCINGIWEIDGGGNRYFDALDFSIRRVTEVGCVAAESVIEAEGRVFYASDQGAIQVFVDPEARVLVAENITLEKVNTKWGSIDRFHLQALKSIYDPIEKRLFFMYDNSASPTARTFNYTEILMYDLRLDAFYVTKFPSGNTFAEPTFIKGFVRPESYNRSGEAIIKFLTWGDGNSGVDNLRWAELTDNTNFQELGEIDAAGFFTTGFESMGDPSKDKQVKKLTTFMTRVDGSSLDVRFRWDFAESSITGKFTPSIEAYRPPRLFLGTGQTQANDGYPVVFTKHDVPGQGIVLQMRMDTALKADAQIIGWSVDFQGVQSQ